MNEFLEKLATLWPQIVMGIGACVCMLTGLSTSPGWRRAPPWMAALSLIAAGWITAADGDLTGISRFVNLAVVFVGLVLLLVAAQLPEQWRSTRQAEYGRKPFDPADLARGEFFAFFLFSLTGVMLCASAGDLVWLFLALELTSLPTYVMVATGRDRAVAQEAAVKYFFLGAMAAAVFLYGFTLIYGATGFTDFHMIAATISQMHEPSPLLITGVILALVGIAFKIAAVPMHFYAADVYQGAAIPVTTFLAFVPKTAGFVSMLLILDLVAWPLPAPIMWTLWAMAALTMTAGNVLGLLQSDVKRVLAYSSIAHSGYILVALIGGPANPGQTIGQGAAAVLFYLVAYGLATIGAFAVLGCLEVRDDEATTFDDLAGLSSRHPIYAAIMLLSVLSLIGLPPLVGFIGKIYLFGSAIEHGFVGLVVIAVINSAVSAVYYLRIVAACYWGETEGESEVEPVPILSRPLGAMIAALASLILGITGGWLVDAAQKASTSQDDPYVKAPAQLAETPMPDANNDP